MSVMQNRGGIPVVFRDTIDTTGREHNPRVNINYIIARNKGAGTVRMYFTEADFDANVRYVELPQDSAADPYGEWRGPVEANMIWLRAVTVSCEVEVVTFQRRG